MKTLSFASFKEPLIYRRLADDHHCPNHRAAAAAAKGKKAPVVCFNQRQPKDTPALGQFMSDTTIESHEGRVRKQTVPLVVSRQ